MSILSGESCGGRVLHTINSHSWTQGRPCQPSAHHSGRLCHFHGLRHWSLAWQCLSQTTHIHPGLHPPSTAHFSPLPGELSTNNRNVLRVTQGYYEHQIRAPCTLCIQMVRKVVVSLFTLKLLWSNMSCHLHVLC